MEQTKKPLPGAVLLLAALGFVLGTCEFVIVGILPEIAEGLNTSLAAVGKLVSVFAACYAVGTPVITAATGGISRRKLLAVLRGVFLLTSAASFAAPNVAVLYATRVVAALVSGTLTAVAMLYAKEVAAPEQTARAISLVYGGFSVAAVLGVPLGTAVCQILGWRWTFAVILAMGAALLPLLLRSLPAVPAQADSGLLKSFSILWDPRCSLCVGMILCSASATYIVYTYLSPILTETLGLPAGAVSPLLLVMERAAPPAISSPAGWGAGRPPDPAHGLRRPGGAVCPAAAAAGKPVGGPCGVFAMGLLMYLLNTPAQMHALSLAEQDYPFASSLCASVQPVSYNFGIAIGSFIGSAVQEGGDSAPGPAGGNVRPGGTGAEPAASARQRPPDGRGGILRTIKTGSGRISPGLF
ncbi:MAG: MFS transporter [Dysosmobacter welbionis]